MRPLSCPACLEELTVDAKEVRPFRCARGHSYDALGLLNEHSRRAEELRSSLTRALEDALSFSTHLSELADDQGRRELRLYLDRKGSEARALLDLLRSA